MQYIIDVLKGILIGICFTIPGFSGGTMAVLLGCYQKIIEFISLAKAKIKEHWKFILCLVIGALVGMFAFSKVLTLAFANYPIATRFAFMGLVLGGLPFIFKQSEVKKVQPIHFVWFLLGLAVMVALYFVKAPTNTIVAELSVGTFFTLLGSSILAAFVMVIPGISGSFTLLVLGQYETIINAISTLNILILIPTAIGCLIGIIGGANLIKVLLRKYKTQTYLVILGLIIGSLLVLWPGFNFDLEGLIAVILLVVGALASYFFSHIKAK
ncbi:MAG: DUF368 domain-containing protein [Bacilli bacterium]|jgi:putative membrane protein